MEEQRKAGPMRVLVLEDVPTDAEIILRELRKVGIAFVSQRVDTREGFEQALRDFKPDLILSDFSLPASFDGLTALDAARTLVGWRRLRLDAARRAVRLDRHGMRLDLGGIAKGYILQEAVRTLRACR